MTSSPDEGTRRILGEIAERAASLEDARSLRGPALEAAREIRRLVEVALAGSVV